MCDSEIKAGRSERTKASCCVDGIRIDDAAFRAIADYAVDWENWVDSTGVLLWVNCAVERHTGYSSAECRAMPDFPICLIHEADRDFMRSHFESALRGNHGEGVEFRVVRKDGSVKWCEVCWQPMLDSAGGNLGHRSTVRDITDRKARELEIERLNRLYSALSKLNATVVRIESREELFREVCRIAAEQAGFKVAWIGCSDPKTHEVKPIARAGAFQDYLDKIKIFSDDRPEGRGPVGTCIREGKTCIFSDFFNHVLAAPWQAAAAEYGLRAVAALPISYQGEIFGSLTVYDDEPKAFREKEIALLEEVATAVSLTLERLDGKARRQRGEEILRESEYRYRSLFENMLDGFAYCKMLFDEENRPTDFVYLAVNKAFERLTGLHDVIGKRVTAVIPGVKELSPELFEIYGRVALTGKPEEFEIDFKPLNLWLSVSAYGIEKGCFVAVFDNITARKRLEEKSRQAQEQWERTFDAVPDLIAVLDQDKRVVRVNRAMADRLGVSREECVGQVCHELVHGTDTAPETCPHRLFALDGREHTGELREEKLKSNLLVTVSPLRDFRGQSKACVHVARDITEERRSRRERETTLALLRLLNDQNHTHELIRNLTGFLQEWSGCEAVGIRLRDGDDFPYFETRGFSKEFLLVEDRLCQRDADGRIVRDGAGNAVLECMCGNVLCGRFDPSLPFFTPRGSFWTNGTTELLASTSETERQTRTRNYCNTVGYESVALIPLRHGQQTLGLLQLNDHAKGRFTPELITFLENAGDQIAIALAQRQIQAALRESEERYRRLFEVESDAIILVDCNTESILDANAAALKLYGYSREEFMDKTIGDISGEIDMTRQAVRSGETYIPLRMHRRKDGMAFPVEIVVSYFELGGRRVHVAAIRDITNRQRMKEALGESEKRYRTLFTSMTEGFALHEIICDDKGKPYDYRFLDINPAFERLTGLTREVIGRSVSEVLPDEAMQWSETYGAVALTGQAIQFERYSAAIGRVFEVFAYCPAPRQFATVFMDITERKRSEEAIQEMQSQLAHVARLSTMGEMAAGIAHDVNQPLYSIVNYAKACGNLLLQRDADKEKLMRWNEQIAAEATRAGEIIRRMRSLARKEEVRRLPNSVHEVIEEALTLIAFETRSLRVKVCKDLAESARFANFDRIQIQQVLINLLRNGCEALEQIPRDNRVLTIETNAAEMFVEIVVSDNGYGLQGIEAARIFDAFVTSKPAGLGMGLAICRSIIEVHGGRIWVTENPEGGVAFHFTLPATPGESNHD